MGVTTIEWTDRTWNPVRGCSRVSQGCTNCYAEAVAARFCGPGLAYEGLARMGENGPRWTGDVRMVPEHLDDPLRWRRPRRIFVNSMSDLFHEKLTNEEIAAVFGVMVLAQHHTFQILTKRARRMREFFQWLASMAAAPAGGGDVEARVCLAAMDRIGVGRGHVEYPPWPLPNVWLGVSAENQETADERIPLLLETPAAVRFVSAEPLLGPISLERAFGLKDDHVWQECVCPEIDPSDRPCLTCDGRRSLGEKSGLHWVIVGGESGPRARPFDVAWASSIVQQCKAAGAAVFVKQLGSHPFDSREAGRDSDEPHPGGAAADPDCRLHLLSKKGGDPSEWDEGLRVRDFPAKAAR